MLPVGGHVQSATWWTKVHIAVVIRRHVNVVKDDAITGPFLHWVYDMLETGVEKQASVKPTSFTLCVQVKGDRVTPLAKQ